LRRPVHVSLCNPCNSAWLVQFCMVHAILHDSRNSAWFMLDPGLGFRNPAVSDRRLAKVGPVGRFRKLLALDRLHAELVLGVWSVEGRAGLA